jgi:hypothetical protein
LTDLETACKLGARRPDSTTIETGVWIIESARSRKMTTETTRHGTAGGFAGDPAEAFTPPAPTGGCCGSPARETVQEPAADTCCGTAAEAQASGGCCGAQAKADAVAAGAGCCG